MKRLVLPLLIALSGALLFCQSAHREQPGYVPIKGRIVHSSLEGELTLLPESLPMYDQIMDEVYDFEPGLVVEISYPLTGAFPSGVSTTAEQIRYLDFKLHHPEKVVDLPYYSRRAQAYRPLFTNGGLVKAASSTKTYPYKTSFSAFQAKKDSQIMYTEDGTFGKNWTQVDYLPTGHLLYIKMRNITSMYVKGISKAAAPGNYRYRIVFYKKDGQWRVYGLVMSKKYVKSVMFTSFDMVYSIERRYEVFFRWFQSALTPALPDPRKGKSVK